MTKKRLFSETDLGIESISKELYIKRQMLNIEKKIILCTVCIIKFRAEYPFTKRSVKRWH